MYKLSPSDFAYLYEECKHCFVLKVKYGIFQPTKPMPGVFGAINTRLQGALVGHDLRTLSPSLPGGVVESQEGWVESKPIPGTKVFIKGKYDLLVHQSDGTYLIVDLKISSPNEEKIAKYRTQLEAYKYALENPGWGEPKKLANMGLLVLYPDKARFENGEALLSFPPTWMEVPHDDDGFVKFISEISMLLEGPMPSETATCLWCKYRHLGEKLSHPKTDDIPF